MRRGGDQSLADPACPQPPLQESLLGPGQDLGGTSPADDLASQVCQQSNPNSVQAHRQDPRTLCCTKRPGALSRHSLGHPSPMGLPTYATRGRHKASGPCSLCGVVLPQHTWEPSP